MNLKNNIESPQSQSVREVQENHSENTQQDNYDSCHKLTTEMEWAVLEFTWTDSLGKSSLSKVNSVN